jgi:hypothetical protein
MNAAPVAAELVDEEIWLIVDPFRNQFPQGVTGIGDGKWRPARMVGSPKWADAGKPARGPVLFHPDYTVGSGITPDLLTLWIAPEALAGFGLSPIYRRWGVAPRPENLPAESSTDPAHIDLSRCLCKQAQRRNRSDGAFGIGERWLVRDLLYCR